MLAPARFALAQPYVGGLEALVATLVTALRRRGHHITLYAPAGTSKRLADVLVPFPEPPRLSAVGALDPGLPEPDDVRDHHAFASAVVDLTRRVRQREVDAILNHTLHALPLLLGALLDVPLVTTLHTPPLAWMELGAGVVPPSGRFVAVSHAIAAQWTTLDPMPTVVLNGIDTADFPAGRGGPDLAWLGRITPEKGTHVAIEAARRAGRRLTVAGPAYDAGYFENVIAPLLDGDDVRYAGHLDHGAASALLGASSALLVTPRWDEPFGLVAAEAALCGTPVVGVARGGLEEVVTPGLGVLVPDASDAALADRLAQAIGAAESLERDAVQAEARTRFSAERMAREYETTLFELVPRTPGRAQRLQRPVTSHAGPVRVQHIPAGHAYTRRVCPSAGSGIVRLDDPAVPGAPPGRWWPHPALESSWVRDHAHELDVVHLHFGFEHRSPAQLEEWAGILRRNGVGLVLTVHDLDDPHTAPGPEGEADRRRYVAGLDVLLRAADEITTLTRGAAREIERRSGRTALVHRHPHIVGPSWLARVREEHDGFVVGVHAKSLRASFDVAALDELVAATALPHTTLRLHVHADVLERTHPRHDPRLARLAHTPPPHVDVRVHEPLADDELWNDLLECDLAVLPYRSGTHSGWLEMCHDLGTAVLAPDVGYLTQQRPVWSWTRGASGDLTRALLTARAAHRAGMRAARPDAETALREAEEVRRLHAALYRRVIARYHRVRRSGETGPEQLGKPEVMA